MIPIERQIKELCIALEALSRINTHEALNFTREINELLEKLIKETKEKPTATNTYIPTSSRNLTDDDIPF